MHTDACRATAVRGEQPAEVLALRMACLGTDRELTRQLVDVLAAPGFRGVSQAVAAVDALPRLTACADIAALRSVVPLPDDPGKRFRLAVLERRVAELKARWLLDEQSAVRRGAPELVTEAQGIGYPPATSDALMLAGQAETTLGDLKRAEDLLYQGLWAAEAAHDPERVARAWITIMRMVGQDQRRFAEGERLLRNAEQAAERAAGVSPSVGNELRIRLLANGAALLFAEGKRKDAIARIVEALDLETRHNGPDTAVAAQLHHSLAVMKVTSGDPDGAWPEIQRALAIAGQRLGNGPLTARFHGAAASILRAQGKLDDAIREFEHSLVIDAQVFPDDNAEVAFQMASLADTYQARRAYDRAEPLLQRALAILARTRGPESAEVSAALNLLGTNAANLGHLAEAQADFERALAISEKAEGPDHYHVSERLIALGTVLIDQGHADRARPYLERGLAILEAQRAGGHGVYAGVLADAQLELARSLWTVPRERPRARTLARSARRLVDDPRFADVAHKIDDWSAAHR
jgi:tetratricopeptide (TPR) repeat protein